MPLWGGTHAFLEGISTSIENTSVSLVGTNAFLESTSSCGRYKCISGIENVLFPSLHLDKTLLTTDN